MCQKCLHTYYYNITIYLDVLLLCFTPCRWILCKFFLKGSQACSDREPSSSRTSISLGEMNFHACHVIGQYLSSFLSATAVFQDAFFFFFRRAEGAVISKNQKCHSHRGCRGTLDSERWLFPMCIFKIPSV